MWILFITRLYKRGELLNWGLIIAIFFFTIFSVSVSIKFYQLKIKQSGIIVEGEVPVRSSANEKGIVLFNLHEGAELTVLDELGTFYRIELKDAKGGWVRKDFIGVI